MPALAAAGHEIALLHEVEEPADQPRLPIPAASPAWSVSALGLDRTIQALREWHPQVIYAHGLLDPAVERETLEIAPAVFFAHDYYGTCISGSKTFTDRSFSPVTGASAGSASGSTTRKAVAASVRLRW